MVLKLGSGKSLIKMRMNSISDTEKNGLEPGVGMDRSAAPLGEVHVRGMEELPHGSVKINDIRLVALGNTSLLK